MSLKGNIAIFVPHEGCPNKCSFCNQNAITTIKKLPTQLDVIEVCENAKQINKDKNISCELAFFGGSFTAIQRNYMVSLLEAVKPYVETNIFSGIRISTRPDKIDDEVLNILKNYHVSAIELGCQSTDLEVLHKNNRGHSFEDIISACSKIKKMGFKLGVQMMTGLYMDTHEKSIKTALDLISLNPDTVRIYPTVVLPDTQLAELYNLGEYKPFTLEETIPLVAEIMMLFIKSNIKIIRVGLHSELEVENTMIAGAYHPAFKELCENYIFLRLAKSILLQNNISKGDIIVEVPMGSISKMVGQKKSGIDHLKSLGYNAKIIENNKLSDYNINIYKNYR